MKIGIIGAENGHASEIAKNINVDKNIRGLTVDYIWGETDEFAKKRAKEGKIPNIVKKPLDMLGKIDALIVGHRHPKYHLKAALPFIKEGIPAYIDKPFCYRVAQGEQFLKLARKLGIPVTSFGVLPEQSSYQRFVKKLNNSGDIFSGTVYGPCDTKSSYGGIFFYGIHQVEMALNAFGFDVSHVLMTKNKQNATGQLIYKDGKIVTLNFLMGCKKVALSTQTNEGYLASDIKLDSNYTIKGIKKFTKMFKTGIEPLEHKKILAPIRVLEALQRSQKTKFIEKI